MPLRRLVVGGSVAQNVTESTPCECVNECKMTSFSSAISTSRMSTMTTLSDILETSDAPDRFVAATETRQRVDASLMMKSVRLLTAAIDAHHMLRGMIDFLVNVAETSIATMQSKFLSSLGDMVRSHDPRCWPALKTWCAVTVQDAGEPRRHGAQPRC